MSASENDPINTAKKTLITIPGVAINNVSGGGSTTARVLTFVVVDERGTEAESCAKCQSHGLSKKTITRTKPVRSVDDEEEHRESRSVPRSGLQIGRSRLVDVSIVQVAQDALGPERLRSAHSRDDFFRERARISTVLQ